MKGLINFKEAELVENQIRLSAINLINEYAKNIDSNMNKRVIPQNNLHSLTGYWESDYFDPVELSYVKKLWRVNSDNTFSVESYRKADNIDLGIGLGQYKLENNILYTYDAYGYETIGLIEWISQDKFVYTILNSNDLGMTDLINLKKIYSRR